MPSSAVAVGCLALAVIAIGATAGCVQQPSETNEPGALQAVAPNVVTVHPARVPVAGSPLDDERMANLRPPPPGPIESRLLPLPAGEFRVRSERRRKPVEPPSAASAPTVSPPPTAAVFAAPPVSSLASAEVRPSNAGDPAPSPDGTSIALIPFSGRSASLTDDMRSRLDQIARSIVDKKLRGLEVRGFATGSDLDRRKVALARALIVRAYLIDAGVKSRIEVGSFAGDGEHVEILLPKT
jgi:outer membrane protein OmpA-like peptidoglycan-associated protein